MMLNPPLPETWRKEAEKLRRIEQASPAAVYELCADEFDNWWREYGDVVLNLQEAARESGYSPHHLGRVVRQGKIANAGCENAPNIRRRDLPRKPGHKPHGLRGAAGRPYAAGAQNKRKIADGHLHAGMVPAGARREAKLARPGYHAEKRAYVRDPKFRKLDAKVQEALTGTDVSTLRRIYDEVSIDDQRAEWARVGIG